MSIHSRRVAGIPAAPHACVVIGGASVLTLLMHDPAYSDDPLRQTSGGPDTPAPASLLILSLAVLRYVDEVQLHSEPDS